MNKKILFSFVIVLLLNGLIFSQWSTDPNNNLIVGYGLDPNICSDSAGGCYITYDYDNLSYPRKLALERIDRYGYKPWGTIKQIIGELPGQWKAEIVEDGEGGVLVSFIDANQTPLRNIIRVQRIDSTGNFLWGPIGVRVSLSETIQGMQKIISDGNGGCIVAWFDTLNEYRINRINNIGERMWGNTGKRIDSNVNSYPLLLSKMSYDQFSFSQGRVLFGFNISGDIKFVDTLEYRILDITSDNNGGVVASWKTGSVSNIKIASQRKDSLGNNLWQEPYVEVADSLYSDSNLSVKSNDSYFFYGWAGSNNGQNKVAQFQTLRSNGTKLFSANGVQISNPPLNGTIIIPLEENKTGFVYYSSDFLPDSLLIQTYDTLGNHLWAPSGVLLSHPPIESQSYTTDKNGGFIIGGTKNEFSIVVQQVNRYGNLGEVLPVPVELISFTGAVDEDKVKLNWITSTELNNYGFEIERVKDLKNEISNEWEKIGFVEGQGTTTETKSYSFIDSDDLSGKVKYRLKQIDFDGSYEYSNEIEVDFDITPKEFVLYQNYPNPFNSSTIIKYQAPVEGRVTISLYNILGEKVKTLIQGDQIKGTHTLVVQSDELPSGHYFYSLESSSARIIKKLTILK